MKRILLQEKLINDTHDYSSKVESILIERMSKSLLNLIETEKIITKRYITFKKEFYLMTKDEYDILLTSLRSIENDMTLSKNTYQDILNIISILAKD